MNRVTILKTACRALNKTKRPSGWSAYPKNSLQANFATTPNRALSLRFYPKQIRNYSASLGRRVTRWFIPRVVLFSCTVGGIAFVEIYLRRRGRPTVSALDIVECEAKSNNANSILGTPPNLNKPPPPSPTSANSCGGNIFIKGMKVDLSQAIQSARDIIQSLKEEVGVPGMVVGVSVDGEEVWKEGFGHSDVENRVPCTPDTVMRIASISKSITMAAVARLWEDGKLDLDKPVQYYVPSFPEKTFNGEKVTITTRHLVSHLSGIRHYDKKPPSDNNNEENNAKASKNDTNNKTKDSIGSSTSPETCSNNNEFSLPEYYIKDKYTTVKEALNLFKDDPLLYKPGTRFLYTTHGWTLISAVAEAASKVPFTTLLKTLFKDMGLVHTQLDENDPLIYNRSRCYIKKKGKLQNAPYVDNSYKWAGGGCVSTVGDLMKFGNAMLYSFQHRANRAESSKTLASNEKTAIRDGTLLIKSSSKLHASSKKILPGYLKPETIKMMWNPISPILTAHERRTGGEWYGMGWGVVPEKRDHAFCRHQKFYVTHSGGAVGASSVLFVLPRDEVKLPEGNEPLPQGVVVVLLANLTEVKLTQAALKIAQIFEKVDV